MVWSKAEKQVSSLDILYNVNESIIIYFGSKHLFDKILQLPGECREEPYHDNIHWGGSQLKLV